MRISAACPELSFNNCGGEDSSTSDEETTVYPQEDHAATFHNAVVALHKRLLVKVPWTEVGVRILEGESTEEPRKIPKRNIKAKSVVSGDIISSMYPEWVIT